jgi:hypothetical protein
MHNATDFAALRELRACVALCDAYTELFNKLVVESKKELPPHLFGTGGEVNLIATATAITAFAVFNGLLSSGLQLLSLFRTDQEIKSYKIEVEDQVLAITVAGYLKQGGAFDVFASTIVPVGPLQKST